MTKYIVCKLSDIDIGKITPVKVGRAPVIVSRLPSGQIRAVGGRCPHQGAAFEHGCISGTTESESPNVLNFCNNGETLRCPWHGFEFSLLDGQPTVPAAPQRPMMLRFYDVEVDGDDIVVTT